MYYWYLLPATVEMVGFAYPYPMLCAQIYDYSKLESHQQPFKQQFTKRKGTSPARQFS